MVLDPFEASRAKIENGREHIALAESRFEAFAATNPIAAVELPSSMPGLVRTEFQFIAEMPLNISLAAGDAIHNFRSALDIMAGDVVRLSGGNPKGVHFPFANSEEELEVQIKRKNFHKVTPEAIALLRSYQPYKGGNITLRALHDLDNTDKHQFIEPAYKTARVPAVHVGGNSFIGVAFGPGASFNVSPGTPLVVQGNPTPVLHFAPGRPLEREEVIPALHRFGDHTSAIVEAFANLFR